MDCYYLAVSNSGEPKLSPELHEKFDKLLEETLKNFRRLEWKTNKRFYRLIKELSADQSSK